MLIKVFGMWLIMANISHLHQDGSNCRVVMNESERRTFWGMVVQDKSCDDVATVINRTAKESEDKS